MQQQPSGQMRQINELERFVMPVDSFGSQTVIERNKKMMMIRAMEARSSSRERDMMDDYS